MFMTLIDFVSANLLFIALHIGNHGSFPAPLKATEEKDCLEKMKKGDQDARDKLIEHNLRLVAHIVKKYYATNSDQEDLLSIGTIGLIKGINTFDPSKGTRLATYAARCIENEVLMYFRNIKKSAQDISLNEPIESDGDGNSLSIMDLIQEEDMIVEELSLKIDKKRVRKYVNEIENERDRKIIIRRYGMDNKKSKTQREVAEEMNISRSYVSRLEKRILEELRKRMENERGMD